MTSPVEEITVECPGCSHRYESGYRASYNVDLERSFSVRLHDDGTIVAPMRAEHESGAIGDGRATFRPGDPQYAEMLAAANHDRRLGKEYLRKISTGTCPTCGHVVDLGVLVVEGDVWTMGGER